MKIPKRHFRIKNQPSSLFISMKNLNLVWYHQDNVEKKCKETWQLTFLAIYQKPRDQNMRWIRHLFSKKGFKNVPDFCQLFLLFGRSDDVWKNYTFHWLHMWFLVIKKSWKVSTLNIPFLGRVRLVGWAIFRHVAITQYLAQKMANGMQNTVGVR